jgi:hypothetical protein
MLGRGFFHLHEFDRFVEHLSPFTRGVFTFMRIPANLNGRSG